HLPVAHVPPDLREVLQAGNVRSIDLHVGSARFPFLNSRLCTLTVEAFPAHDCNRPGAVFDQPLGDLAADAAEAPGNQVRTVPADPGARGLRQSTDPFQPAKPGDIPVRSSQSDLRLLDLGSHDLPINCRYIDVRPDIDTAAAHFRMLRRYRSSQGPQRT